MKNRPVPSFLTELLHARSPSGHETEAQAVFDRHVKPVADTYAKDTMGNRIACLNPSGSPTVLLAGHMDELGFVIKHVNAQGFLYFATIGGHDRTIIPGRRVVISTAHGTVKGVTGKRAVHLMTEEERKKMPEIHDIWIDIGAKSKTDALDRVAIGDTATYDHEFELLHGSVGAARAFDDKVGAYIVGETLIRLAKAKNLVAKVVAVGTVQEEVGLRGATAAAYSVHPDWAVAVDVGHATDHPDCDARKFGETKLGGGPIISQGPNFNPVIVSRLVAAARRLNMPVQMASSGTWGGTDAGPIQVSRGGVATGLVSVPLRYMHTPSELVDLQDVERCIELLVQFILSLKKNDRGEW